MAHTGSDSPLEPSGAPRHTSTTYSAVAAAPVPGPASAPFSMAAYVDRFTGMRLEEHTSAGHDDGVTSSARPRGTQYESPRHTALVQPSDVATHGKRNLACAHAASSAAPASTYHHDPDRKPRRARGGAPGDQEGAGGGERRRVREG